MRTKIKLGASAKRVTANVSWLFVEKLLRIVLGLAVGIWVARYLGPANFGIFSYASALVGLLAILPTAGISSVVVRDLVKCPHRTNEILGSAALVQITLGVLAYSLLTVLVVLLRPSDSLSQTAVLVLGLSLLLKFSDVAAYWFEAQVLAKFTAASFLVASVASAALRVAFIQFEMGLVWFVWALVLEALVAAVLLMLLFVRKKSSFSITASAFEIKRLLKQGFPLLLASAAASIYLKIDQIMLGSMVDNNAVGIYGAAVRITEAFLFLPIIITSSVFPFVLKSKENGNAVYDLGFERLFSLLAMLAIVTAVPISLYATGVMTFLFDASYSSAGPLLAIHVWSNVFAFVGIAAYRWYVAEGMQNLLMYRTGLGAVINIALNVILIPAHGAIGAAVATVVSQLFSVFFLDWFQKETRGLFWLKLRSLNLFRTISILPDTLKLISR